MGTNHHTFLIFFTPPPPHVEHGGNAEEEGGCITASPLHCHSVEPRYLHTYFVASLPPPM
jgi:hypothetical protein